MTGDRLSTEVLSVQYLPNADPMLLKGLRVPKAYTSLGIMTTDCDDVGYAALDEATKKADVRVV
ncbi:MAG: BMC domain-containing protein, partial [Oscillospiraceae bacterium]